MYTATFYIYIEHPTFPKNNLSQLKSLFVFSIHFVPGMFFHQMVMDAVSEGTLIRAPYDREHLSVMLGCF